MCRIEQAGVNVVETTFGARPWTESRQAASCPNRHQRRIKPSEEHAEEEYPAAAGKLQPQ